MSNLPTRIGLQTCNLHAINSATWSRNIAIRRTGEIILAARATGKLHCKSFSLEFCSIYTEVR